MPKAYTTRSSVKFEVVGDFRDREGFAIVASVRADGHLLEYQCIPPQATPQEAMEALAERIGYLWDEHKGK